MKIGVFGGTFDPIHAGHLVKAEEMREALALDKVWFVPAGLPWMKDASQISPAEHRLAMVRLAVASNPSFEVLDVEVRRPGPTFTVDTLAELKATLGPAVELFLVVGMDSLRDLERWRQPERVLELATLVTFARSGAESLRPEWLERIRPGASRAVKVVEGLRVGITGTELRRRVAEGRSIRYWVPEAVEAYIRQHGLYRVAVAQSGGVPPPSFLPLRERRGSLPPVGEG